MPYVTIPYGGKWATIWQNPPADEKYARAATAGYGAAGPSTLATPGVPGLSYGRYFGPVASPWLWLTPGANFPAYTTPDESLISRGAPAATGQGSGTPAGRGGPGPSPGAIEIAPGVWA